MSKVSQDKDFSRMNKEFNYWFSHINQKELQYKLAVKLYLQYESPTEETWRECIEEARLMLDIFFEDVLSPETRKW